jgi:hypothetical protein
MRLASVIERRSQASGEQRPAPAPSVTDIHGRR